MSFRLPLILTTLLAGCTPSGTDSTDSSTDTDTTIDVDSDTDQLPTQDEYVRHDIAFAITGDLTANSDFAGIASWAFVPEDTTTPAVEVMCLADGTGVQAFGDGADNNQVIISDVLFSDCRVVNGVEIASDYGVIADSGNVNDQGQPLVTDYLDSDGDSLGDLNDSNHPQTPILGYVGVELNYEYNDAYYDVGTNSTSRNSDDMSPFGEVIDFIPPTDDIPGYLTIATLLEPSSANGFQETPKPVLKPQPSFLESARQYLPNWF